ncbi:MAG: class I SAM-dependent methyltransferase [Planctomycetota bacterium]
MISNTMEAQRCRASGSPDLRTILDFGDVPLADVLLDRNDPAVLDQTFPLRLVFCPDSALVQLIGDVPPDILWGGNYPYYTSVNPTLVQHFTEAAEEIMAAQPVGPGSLVIEAASNDGYQLDVFRRSGARVLGIDPASGPAQVANDKGIETRCALFDRHTVDALLAEGHRADILVGNNVLNLIPDPREFADDCARLLKPDGLLVLEVPYLVDTIDMVAFDNVYHQNVTYWTVTSLQRLFEDVGLELVDVKRIPTFGGSLRASFRRGSRPGHSVEALLAEEIARGADQFEFYEAFGERSRAIRESLRARLIELHAAGKRIAAYGAAGGMATTLLAFLDLPEGVLEYAVDLSPHKLGRWTSGYRLQIFPPDRLDEDVPDYALLLAWNFEPQVLAQRSLYRDRGGRFLVPIPEVREGLAATSEPGSIIPIRGRAAHAPRIVGLIEPGSVCNVIPAAIGKNPHWIRYPSLRRPLPRSSPRRHLQQNQGLKCAPRAKELSAAHRSKETRTPGAAQRTLQLKFSLLETIDVPREPNEQLLSYLPNRSFFGKVSEPSIPVPAWVKGVRFPRKLTSIPRSHTRDDHAQISCSIAIGAIQRTSVVLPYHKSPDAYLLSGIPPGALQLQIYVL